MKLYEKWSWWRCCLPTTTLLWSSSGQPSWSSIDLNNGINYIGPWRLVPRSVSNGSSPSWWPTSLVAHIEISRFLEETQFQKDLLRPVISQPQCCELWCFLQNAASLWFFPKPSFLHLNRATIQSIVWEYEMVLVASELIDAILISIYSPSMASPSDSSLACSTVLSPVNSSFKFKQLTAAESKYLPWLGQSNCLFWPEYVYWDRHINCLYPRLSHILRLPIKCL